MRIETCGKNNFSIFLNTAYINKCIYDNKDELIKYIKLFIVKIKRKLNLNGFYKVKVFLHKKIGIFLDLIKLDDVDISNSLDLRIVVFEDENIFFETDDYDLIKNCNEKRYINGLFYCVVDDYFDGILEKVEFGRFIYGKDVINLLNNSIIL